jgi:hypothetical protein
MVLVEFPEADPWHVGVVMELGAIVLGVMLRLLAQELWVD